MAFAGFARLFLYIFTTPDDDKWKRLRKNYKNTIEFTSLEEREKGVREKDVYSVSQ